MVSYRIYYGKASRTYVQAAGQGLSSGTTTAYVVTGLTAGTYYFAVTSVDAAGNESSYSNEAIKTIP